MMDVEQVLAQAVAPYVETVGDAVDAAVAGLAALRSAGFQVFKPEDCEVGVADGVTFANNPDGKDGLILLVPSRSHTADRGTYFLVPADSGGSG